MLVQVHDNNVDAALRKLKKMMRREGISREMRQRQSYEKPSERRQRERKESRRRADRRARLIAIEEGIITQPVRKDTDGQQGQTPAVHHPSQQRLPLVTPRGARGQP